jgi:hypothetical protein
MVDRARHLSAATLADLTDGRLTPSEHERALAHTSGCERCARSLRGFQRLVEVMQSDRSEDAPPSAVAAVIRSFGQRPRPEHVPALQRIAAVLRFDSLQRPRALGVRAGRPAPRHLLFSAGEYEIDLRLSERDGRWTIEGQVLGPFEGGEIEILGGSANRATISPMGEFLLAPVPAGRYRIVLSAGPIMIEVVDLEIGP